MSRPRLPPPHRHHAPALGANSVPQDGDVDDDSDADGPDFPEDFDEHVPIDLGALGALLDADDDYDPMPEQSDFWIERDDD